MIIRKGNITDLDQLDDLYNQVNDYLFTNQLDYPGWAKGIYPIRETARKGTEDNCLYVAQIGDRIVGSVILTHKQDDVYAHVKWIAKAEDKNIIVVKTLVVHPLFMNRMVGACLMNFAKELAVNQKMAAIRLDVSVKNIPAISLYERIGFSYIDTIDLGLSDKDQKWFRFYELVL